MKQQTVRSFNMFAVLLMFTAQYGISDFGQILRIIRQINPKGKRDPKLAKCSGMRELCDRETEELRIKRPALEFFLPRGTRPWVVYVETYRDKRRMVRTALRLLDARDRDKLVNGHWCGCEKGTDPIRFLREKDLPARKD